MVEKTELVRAVDLFVREEYYRSRQPESRLHDYTSLKHLAFDTNVDGRTDEFIVYHSNPAQVIDTINQLDIKKDYWLTVFSDEVPHTYDAEGYTIKSTEFLMILNLDSWSFETENKIIKCVKTEGEAQRINHVFNKTVIDLNKLNEPNLYFYVGEDNRYPVSHGSFVLLDKTAFLNNVYTSKIHRGKGMAKHFVEEFLLMPRGKVLSRVYLFQVRSAILYI